MKNNTIETHKTVIELPVSLGDTIYKKQFRIVNCRYFGDRYSAENGQPNCEQHEYDCDFGDNCDATVEYYVEPVTVDELLLSSFASDIIRHTHYMNAYLITNEAVAEYLQKNEVTCADCDYYKSDTDNCCIGENTTCCEFVQRKCYG